MRMSPFLFLLDSHGTISFFSEYMLLAMQVFHLSTGHCIYYSHVKFHKSVHLSSYSICGASVWAPRNLCCIFYLSP